MYLTTVQSEGFRVTTQRDQACLIARSYIDAIASGVAPNISWYDFRNDGTDPFNFEHNMGIVTRDFRPKPAYRAYATVATMLDGLHVDGELKLGENVFAYRFTGEEGESAGLRLVEYRRPRRRSSCLQHDIVSWST